MWQKLQKLDPARRAKTIQKSFKLKEQKKTLENFRGWIKIHLLQYPRQNSQNKNPLH
jgi:hypothetical protein